MKKNKASKKLTKEQQKSTWTFFTLLFPSLILTILLMFPRGLGLGAIGILLFFYQAVVLKRFIEDYYHIGNEDLEDQ